MTTRLLANELYAYLQHLAGVLVMRDASDLSQKVNFASRFASGSTTELYGESRKALRLVEMQQNGILSEAELNDLRDKLAGIDAEFERIGGG